MGILQEVSSPYFTKMKKIFFILISFVILLPLFAENEVTLLPRPVEMKQTGRTVAFGKHLEVGYSKPLTQEARFLQSFMEHDFGADLVLKRKSKKATIQLILDANVLAGKTESYVLEIAPEQIKIMASSAAGIFYGVQSLRQLLTDNGNTLSAPALKMQDYPRFAWRAFMLDEARNFKGVAVVKDLLDEMASLKMNVFHWHLTNDQGWRIEIKKYPKLTTVGAYRDSTELHHFGSNVFDGKPHGGFYTQKEIRELVQYAADRHITIVPEITIPGHFTAAVAAYPWLGTRQETVKVSPKFGVHYAALNVANPKVYEFLSDVFDEVIDLFPSPVIHIGGDELRYNHWNESPQVQAYMKEHGLHSGAELQVHFTNRVSKMLNEKGRSMMGWNEITGDRLHDYQANNDKGEMSSVLAKGTLVQFWQGSPLLMNKAINQGYDIVNSYNTYTYLDYDYNSISLKKAYSFNPVPEGIDKGKEKHVIGMGCQMWGEFIPTVESMNAKVYPRIAAYAEVGWTQQESKDYQNFMNSLDYFLQKWKSKGIIYGPLK